MIDRCVRKAGVLVGLVAALIFNLVPNSVTANNVTLDFNIQEILTVSIKTPDTAAQGNIYQFLRNDYSLEVTTNNNNGGCMAYMNTKSTTANLVNVSSSNSGSGYTIPTLASDTTRGNFPNNYWGYSINDSAAGASSSTYSKVATQGVTPNAILSSSSCNHVTKNVYFGTKVDGTKAAGKYTTAVVFTVVTGSVAPDDYVVPGGDSPSNPSYDSGDDTTVYTSTTHTTAPSGNTTTTTTEISKGDNRSGYAAPQGVTTTMSTTSIGEGTPLATGLAATAAVAATTGIIFFIVAKRRKDDDEEEEEELD